MSCFPSAAQVCAACCGHRHSPGRCCLALNAPVMPDILPHLTGCQHSQGSWFQPSAPHHTPPHPTLALSWPLVCLEELRQLGSLLSTLLEHFNPPSFLLLLSESAEAFPPLRPVCLWAVSRAGTEAAEWPTTVLQSRRHHGSQTTPSFFARVPRACLWRGGDFSLDLWQEERSAMASSDRKGKPTLSIPNG